MAVVAIAMAVTLVAAGALDSQGEAPLCGFALPEAFTRLPANPRQSHNFAAQNHVTLPVGTFALGSTGHSLGPVGAVGTHIMGRTTVAAADPASTTILVSSLFGRLVTAASVGAVASVVSAFLSSFTEPVINRVLVCRMTFKEAFRDVRLRDCLRFFETALATNLIKFPFFEVVSVAVDYLPVSTWTRGLLAGVVYSTAMVPVSNYRYCMSMKLDVDISSLYEAYWSTTLRDMVYGLVRKRTMTELSHSQYQLFDLEGGGNAHLALYYFISVFFGCIGSSPWNELRAYILQRRINAKRDGGGPGPMSFSEFFQPQRFVRSTVLGSLIVAAGVGLGALVAPAVEGALVHVKRSIQCSISPSAMLWGALAGLVFLVVLKQATGGGVTRSFVTRFFTTQTKRLTQPDVAYDPFHRPRMLEGISQLTSDKPGRLVCDDHQCTIEFGDEESEDAKGTKDQDGNEKVLAPAASGDARAGEVNVATPIRGYRILGMWNLKSWWPRGGSRPARAVPTTWRSRATHFPVPGDRLCGCPSLPALHGPTAVGVGGTTSSAVARCAVLSASQSASQSAPLPKRQPHGFLGRLRLRLRRVVAAAAGAASAAPATGSSSSAAAAAVTAVAPPLTALGPWGRQAARIMSWRIRLFILSSFGLMVLNMTMTAIDKAFVGRISSLELAAMGAAGTIFDCCSFMVTFMNTALLSLLGQALADRDPEQANRIISHALVFTLGISVMVNGFLVMRAPDLARFVGAEPQMVPIASLYLRIRAMGGPLERFCSIGTSICIAHQDSRTPLMITLVCATLNIVGNWLLCYKVFPSMPAGSCAAASLGAAAVSALLLLRRLQVAGWGPSPLRWPRSSSDMAPFVCFAGPVFLLVLTKSMMFAHMTAFSTRMGEVIGAAHQVVVSLFFVFSVAVAQPFSWAGQSFLPTYIARRNHPDRKTRPSVGSAEESGHLEEVAHGDEPYLKYKGGARGLRACLTSLSVVCIQCALLAGCIVWGCLLPGGPVRLFTGDARVLAAIRPATVPVVCAVLLYPLFMATEGCLIAAKRLGWALFASCTLLVLDLSSLTVLARMGRLTLTSLWAATAFAMFAATTSGLLAFWRCVHKARTRRSLPPNPC